MKIKNILNDILFGSAFLLFVFFGITFGDECDVLNSQMGEALQAYNQCYDNCCNGLVNSPDYYCTCVNPSDSQCNPSSVNSCEDVQCASQGTLYESLSSQYYDCMNNTLGVSGPEFVGEWDGGTSFSPLINFSYHGNNLWNYEQTFNCDGITVNGGSVNNIQQCSHGTCCYVHINNISANTVTINVPAGVATIGGHLSDAGSRTYTRPATGNPITISTPEISQRSWISQLNLGIVVPIEVDENVVDIYDVECIEEGKITASTNNGNVTVGSFSCHLNDDETAFIVDTYVQVTGSDVTVTINEGFITYDESGIVVNSPQKTQTFHREEPQCENPKEASTECATAYGPSYTESGNCCITTCEKPATATGDCSIHGSTYVLIGGCCIVDPQINCNTTAPTFCKLTNQGTSNYNNQDSVDGNSLIYLKMFGLDNLHCSGNTDIQAAGDRVTQIQTSMVSNCSFTGCVDGKFGEDSRSALLNCASIYCESKGDGYSIPTLNGEENLVCDDTHELEDGKCCKLIPICENPKDSDGGCNSYGSGYFSSGDCCVFDCNQGSTCDNGEKWSTGACKCVCDSSKKCCGIQLNTVVPFIGDCIEMNTDSSRGDTTSVTSVTAFPILVQGLMKILMSAIMVFSFLMVIIAGLMMTTGAFSSGNFAKGKTILKNVIISLILLGCSGLILSLVNPTFFGH